jgi:uncharacterized membrane protein YgcG
MRRLDVKFGVVPHQQTTLTDRPGRLPAREARILRRLLSSFHGRFPQCFFSVFLSEQLPGPIGEYIFWMANRARLGNLQATGPANFDLLLGIDVDARTAALVVGYGLEQYLTEDDLERVLLPATGAFHAGDFAEGIRICIELLTEKMKSLVVASEQGQQVVSTSDPVS